MTPEQQKALAQFALWALREMFDGYYNDLDGINVFEQAEKLGLLDKEPYDPEKHSDECEAEVGDDIHFIQKWVKEAAE